MRMERAAGAETAVSRAQRRPTGKAVSDRSGGPALRWVRPTVFTTIAGRGGPTDGKRPKDERTAK